MTNMPNNNWEAFDACAERLSEYGWSYFSPADNDRSLGITANQEHIPQELIQQCFKMDMIAIGKSDAIVFLENWTESRGARHEAETGLFCGHDFWLYLEDEDFIIELSPDEVRAELDKPMVTTPTKPVLLALGHAAQMGKDACAEILVERHGLVRIAFADTIRNMAYESNPLLSSIVDDVGWERAKQEYMWVRPFLISLGSSARKYLGEDVWVKAVFNAMKPDVSYVITDMRYPNEVEEVVRRGGFTVKVTRKGVDPGEDVADQALIDYTGWDFTIENDGSLEDLVPKVEETLRLAERAQDVL